VVKLAASISFFFNEWPLEDSFVAVRRAGFRDRGTLQVGKKADINIIDFDKLRLFAPEMVYDLPAGGRRLTQRCEGYIATLVAGQPIFENQQPTGALPGRLMRAGQKTSF
jgi:N-acyl-D-amino-acid deacylase